METLKIRSRRGITKIIGTMLSLAGLSIMTIYKGQELSRFKEEGGGGEEWDISRVRLGQVTWYIQLWCTKEKGAVFMTMFNPLTTLMSPFVSYFLVGSYLYFGRYLSAPMPNLVMCILFTVWSFGVYLYCSVIGAVVVVAGLFCLLWGKNGDQKINGEPSKSQELRAITVVLQSISKVRYLHSGYCLVIYSGTWCDFRMLQ